MTEVMEAEILDARRLTGFEAGFVWHVSGYGLAVFARHVNECLGIFRARIDSPLFAAGN
jgi:hypothetical protein